MNHADFDIRFSEFDDMAYLSSWVSQPEGCDPFPFAIEEKEDALKNWIGFSKYKASLTGLFKGTPCSIGTLFLMPYLKVSHHCSFYLIVDPEHRRKGIGSAMVRNLLHLAQSRFHLESVQAEIFVPNPLETVLERLGFQLFARQEDFVRIDSNQSKARVLMECYLNE